jgi:hypothetical protein
MEELSGRMPVSSSMIKFADLDVHRHRHVDARRRQRHYPKNIIKEKVNMLFSRTSRKIRKEHFIRIHQNRFLLNLL